MKLGNALSHSTFVRWEKVLYIYTYQEKKKEKPIIKEILSF
jgi:hypothetical protein